MDSCQAAKADITTWRRLCKVFGAAMVDGRVLICHMPGKLISRATASPLDLDNLQTLRSVYHNDCQVDMSCGFRDLEGEL